MLLSFLFPIFLVPEVLDQGVQQNLATFSVNENTVAILRNEIMCKNKINTAGSGMEGGHCLNNLATLPPKTVVVLNILNAYPLLYLVLMNILRMVSNYLQDSSATVDTK